MEIERKFLVSRLPEGLADCPYTDLIQAYLNPSPVVRIRKAGNEYALTYKGSGFLAREEANLPLTEEAFLHLLKKADGKVIEKRRYKIPFGDYVIELDLFSGDQEGLVLAEVEFPSVEEALRFTGPDWFSEDVTGKAEYTNAFMAYGKDTE